MAAIVDAPDTLKVVIPLTAPLNAAAPVMPYELLPTHVLLLVTVPAVMLVAPSATLLPTVPVKVTFPVPTLALKVRALVTLFNVPPNSKLLLVVVNVVLAPKVAASL